MLIRNNNATTAGIYEKESCRCNEKMCYECSVKNYWSSSENDKKSFAQCPTCTAEYSLNDLHIIKFNGNNEKMKEMEIKAKKQATEIEKLKNQVEKLKSKKTKRREERRNNANPY